MLSRKTRSAVSISQIFSGLAGLGGKKRSGKTRGCSTTASKLSLEALEGRAMLAATDLASITGLVFRDLDGDGFSAGEQLVGANIKLYKDNGDGIFNAASDTLVGNSTTNSEGFYRFDHLTAGKYIVRQPSQTIGGNPLQEKTSAIITITSDDVLGVAGEDIDSFDELAQAVAATPTKKNDSSTESVNTALGGTRKLAATLTSANGTSSLKVNDPDGTPGVLEYHLTPSGKGTRRVVWDGGEDPSDGVHGDGLGGIDLTEDGANTGIQLTIGADKDNGKVTLRLYSGNGNYSKTTVSIPNTGDGTATDTVFVPFSAFVTEKGAGADPTNIGAVELLIEGVSAVDGQIDALGAWGPTVQNEDFNNAVVDLELDKTVDDPTPAIGSDVEFTITVTNAGGLDATGVAVRDVLPAGLTFVSATTPTGQSYNANTGIWTIGNVAAGETVELNVVATVTTLGLKTNTAQVSATIEPDADSTPNNNDPNEDDQKSVTVSPQAIDLSLTKTVDNASPQKNQNITFTLTVSNAGPANATGVTVNDLLPSGLTYVSSTPGAGQSYDPETGEWTVGSLNSGASATLKIVAKVTTPAIKINGAQVTSADQVDIDSTPDNNPQVTTSTTLEDDEARVTVTPQIADLSITKTVDNANPKKGSTVEFTIVLSNDGPVNGTGIEVTDLMPAGLKYLSSTVTQGTFSGTTGIWNVGSLNVGNTVTLKVRATVLVTGAQRNVAQVTAADQFDIDSTPNNKSSSDIATSPILEDDEARADVLAPTIGLTKRRYLAR